MKPADLPGWLRDAGRPPLVMGVLNVTPDSFSDGGRFESVERAVARAAEMVHAGADWIDIGGESTRPGSSPVEPHEQIRRVVPVVRAVRQAVGCTVLSIDTTRAAVAAAALEAGADVINDISAGRDDPGLFSVAAKSAKPIILMHMQGTPATMQIDPAYSDVVGEVTAFLLTRAAAALQAGIDRTNLLFDPGIGFGKTTAHNLELLQRLSELSALGAPVVLGTSRKGFIGKITGESDPAGRIFGTAATVAWGVANGAAVLRVHDVGPMAQVIRMIRAIQMCSVELRGSPQTPGHQ